MVVRCPRCRHVFPTSEQVDRATLGSLVLSADETCPGCGLTSTFVTSDHFHLLEWDEGE